MNQPGSSQELPESPRERVRHWIKDARQRQARGESFQLDWLEVDLNTLTDEDLAEVPENFENFEREKFSQAKVARSERMQELARDPTHEKRVKSIHALWAAIGNEYNSAQLRRMPEAQS